MYHASLIGKTFTDICETGAVGKIHSVFECAVNIQIDRPINGLVTLLCNNADIMPANLIVHAACWEEPMKSGDTVLFTKDIVYVNNIPVIGGIATAKQWKRLSDEKIATLDKPVFDAILHNCKVVEGYLHKNAPLAAPFPIMPLSCVNPLEFIGLGAGLTPAGDDFLAGMLCGIIFMEKLFGVKNPYLPKISKTIENNLNKTGEISRHFLRYALDGEWGRNTEDFLVALTKQSCLDVFDLTQTASAEDTVPGISKCIAKDHYPSSRGSATLCLVASINRKLSFGASSGADELRGCLFGITEHVTLSQY